MIPAGNATLRKLTGISEDIESLRIGAKRWAIIVGISKYKYDRWSLRYADRDAIELATLLQTPVGGGFDKDCVKTLINEEATTENLNKALRGFLKKPGKDDLVLVYFACHGSPDPDRPKNIYLLTHDTDPDDISGTALPMREVDYALRENLLADRVVIIADTCHSAALGGGIGRRSAEDNSAIINGYLQEMSKSKPGTALLTSAEANESSQEDASWGGGHGVFTHYFLEGMRGKADCNPRDGKVTVGELFEYVRENVLRATNNLQHPCIGTGNYDRNLIMAYTAGVDAELHFDLATQLYEAGWLLDQPERFKDARHHYLEAYSLAHNSQGDLQSINLKLGLTYSALQDYDKAIKVLKEVVKQTKSKALAEALFQLGVTYTARHNYSEAVTSFQRYLADNTDAENRDWVKEYLDELKKSAGTGETRKKYALLIGINKYQSQFLPEIRGSVNDITNIGGVLIDQYGFEKENVKFISDEAATYQAVINELATLKNKVKPHDIVVLHFSGHSNPVGNSDNYLYLHDTRFAQEERVRERQSSSNDLINLLDANETTNAISFSELNTLVNDIPSFNKTFFLDTHAHARHIELAYQEANYAMFVSTAPGKPSYEVPADVNGQTISMGLFSYVLLQVFKEIDPQVATYGQLAGRVVERIHNYRKGQTPIFLGNPRQQLFLGEDHLSFYHFSQRKNFTNLEVEDIRWLYTRFRLQVNAFYPRAHYVFGRAFIEKGNYREAIEALQTALRQKHDFLEAVMALAVAQASSEDFSNARNNFQKSMSSDTLKPYLQDTYELIGRLEDNPKSALLVGINKYNNSHFNLKRAVNNVKALKKVLTERYGFSPSEIKVLLDGDASYQNIMDKFKQLLEKAREKPVFFFFAGNGSVSVTGKPAIVSADGRESGVFDIELDELAKLASEAANLIVVIDAGFNTLSETLEGSGVIPTDTRQKPGVRHIISKEADQPLKIMAVKIGAVNIYNPSIQVAGMRKQFPAKRAGGSKRYVGKMSSALAELMAVETHDTLTCSRLKEKGEKDLVMVGSVLEDDSSEGLVFSNRILQKQLIELLKKFDNIPLFRILQLLPGLIEQRGNDYPEGYLILGVVRAALGEIPKARQDLEKALEQSDENLPEAQYQLGRLLFEHNDKDIARAVSALTRVTELDPDNAAAYYFLGNAIRVLIERESLVAAEKALQTYLGKGAPLGHQKEVQDFLAGEHSFSGARIDV